MFNPVQFYEFGKDRTTSLVGSIYSSTLKYTGSVLGNNQKIYFCPYDAAQILKLDPATDTTSLVGTVYSGSGKWAGACLGSDGKIYFTPLNHSKILEFDTNGVITKLIGTADSSSSKYIGNLMAPNNSNIYHVIFNSTRVMKAKILNMPSLISSDYTIPSDLSTLATSNYNMYYNKF